MISLILIALSVAGILTLSYVGLRPQNVRQRKANQKYRDRQITKLAKTNRTQYVKRYTDEVEQGYPHVRPQDRETYTEDKAVKLHATTDVDNMFGDGRLTYPQLRLTDARLIVIGTILSVIGVLLQTLSSW